MIKLLYSIVGIGRAPVFVYETKTVGLRRIKLLLFEAFQAVKDIIEENDVTRK